MAVCIRSKPKATHEEIAKGLGIPRRTIERMTAALKARGVIVRKNGKRDGYWEVLK